MLYPVVPLYLTAVLGAPVSVVGLIEGLAEGTSSLLKLVSGQLADRRPARLPFVIAGYALAALSKPLLALAGSWPLVLAARLLDRTGKGLRGPARDAIIAASTPPAARGRAFGVHRALDTAGAVLGPALGLVALGWAQLSYRTIFLLAFVPAAAAVALAVTVREPERLATAAPPEPGRRRLDPTLKRLLWVVGVFAVGNSSNAFLLLRARDLGWSATGVIGLYVLYNLVYATAATPLGALSDRVGRPRVLAFGLLVAAVVYAGYALAPGPWAAAGLLALYGLHAGATRSVARAWVSDLSRPDERAAAQGWYQMIDGLGVLAASVLAGLLWDAYGAAAAFLLGAVTSGAAALLLVALGPAPPPRLPAGSP